MIFVFLHLTYQHDILMAHPCRHRWQAFIFKAEEYVVCEHTYTTSSLPIHPSLGIHSSLGRFHILTIVNKAAVDLGAYIFLN